MNWHQGFFRAWIALSILWVLLVGLFNYDSIVSPYPYVYVEPTRYILNPKNNEFGAFGVHAPQYSNLARDKDAGKLKAIAVGDFSWLELYVPSDASTETIESQVDRVNAIAVERTRIAVEEKQRTNLKLTIYAALGVPIVFLALGLGIGWVIMGFRTRTPY